MDQFQFVFVLYYNKLREEQRLNDTKAGFQHINHAKEDKQDFPLAMDNLALAYF